jgi:SAM-dependent methyltransferase
MKRLFVRVLGTLALFGFDPFQTIRSIRGLSSYFRDLRVLKRQQKSAVKPFPLGTPFLCLHERFSESGAARGHYFHQDLLVARRIHVNNPQTHVDVGSRVDGFVAHVASFRKIKVLDIRPLAVTVPNIDFVQADLMAPIDDKLAGCCDSLSCLHALEHFGLGRYGDPVNCDGYLTGLNNLHKILIIGGKFYFSVPIGPQRIEFNAHRVFSVSYLLECFADKYKIDHFSFVDDRGDLHENAAITDDTVLKSFGCVFGCGIFEMTKL